MPAIFNLSNLNAGQWAVIGLSLLLAGWFVAGILVNRRTGKVAHAWLSSALEGFSSKGLAWADLATAAAVMKPDEPDGQIEKMEAVLVLERRENLPLWLFHHVSGKRDSLIIRAVLKKSPAFEAHLVPSSEYALIGSLTQGRDPPLARSEEDGGYSFFKGGDPGEGALAAFRETEARFRGGIQRVTVRPERPQLLFHARLDALRQAPAETLMHTIRDLIRRV
jgi:hypothetical protein